MASSASSCTRGPWSGIRRGWERKKPPDAPLSSIVGASELAERYEGLRQAAGNGMAFPTCVKYPIPVAPPQVAVHPSARMADIHFDAVLDDLGPALRSLGVGEELVAEVIALAETTRNEVLNREAEAGVAADGGA